MKKIISWVVVFLIISVGFAQEFDIEKIEETEEEAEEAEEEYLEEEYAEEEVLIEDRAGTTPDSPFYFVDEVVEDINLAIKEGEDKADYALDISEEKVAEAKLMADKNKSIETEEALIRANNISKIIEQEVSPTLEDKTNEKMEFIKATLEGMEEEVKDWETVKGLIDRQKTQAEKNKIATNLAVKIGDLCEKLAMEDYSLMEAEPRCNPDNAPDWLKNFIEEEINKREEEAKKMLIDQITTCVNDPRECDCSQIPVKSHQLECERSTALAIECEFEQNMAACDKLDEIGPPSAEGMPDFLRDIFEETFTELIAKKEKEMFNKFAPKECIEAGATTREECGEIMMEVHGPPPEECMKDGRFIGEEECTSIMVGQGKIPEECIKDGMPIPEEECRAIMEAQGGEIPEECMVDGEFIGEEKCREIMGGKFETPMTQEMPSGEGGSAGECMVDGEFIGEEECNEIMKKKFEQHTEIPKIPAGEMGIKPEEKGFVPVKYPEGVEYEEKVLVIGKEGAETISKEELEEIKSKAEEKAEEMIEIPEEAEELSKEIGDLEERKEEIGGMEEEIEEEFEDVEV